MKALSNSQKYSHSNEAKFITSNPNNPSSPKNWLSCNTSIRKKSSSFKNTSNRSNHWKSKTGTWMSSSTFMRKSGNNWKFNLKRAVRNPII
jgi:hypothetical protein